MYDKQNYIELELRDVQKLALYMFDEFHNLCEKYDLKYWMDAGTLLGAVRHREFIPWDDDIDLCMLGSDYDAFVTSLYKELPPTVFLQNASSDKDIPAYFSKIRLNHSHYVMKNQKVNEQDCHQGIFIDIFPLDYIPESNFARTIHRFFLRVLLMLLNGSKQNPSDFFVKKWAKNFINYFSGTVRPALVSDTTLFKMQRKLAIIVSDKARFLSISSKPHVYYDRIRHKQDVFPLIKYQFEGKQYWGPKNATTYLNSKYGSDYMQIPPIGQRIQPHGVSYYLSPSIYRQLLGK